MELEEYTSEDLRKLAEEKERKKENDNEEDSFKDTSVAFEIHHEPSPRSIKSLYDEYC